MNTEISRDELLIMRNQIEAIFDYSLVYFRTSNLDLENYISDPNFIAKRIAFLRRELQNVKQTYDEKKRQLEKYSVRGKTQLFRGEPPDQSIKWPTKK